MAQEGIGYVLKQLNVRIDKSISALFHCHFLYDALGFVKGIFPVSTLISHWQQNIYNMYLKEV